jgi:hypothetical protein
VRIFPSRRTAKLESQKTGRVFTGCDDDGGLGGGNFSLWLRRNRTGPAHRAAPDERRHQCETGFGNQDGRTVWYAL